MRAFIISLLLIVGFVVFSTEAHAGRTCCERLNPMDPTKCFACSDTIYYKNNGDDAQCAGDPTCQACPASHPVANACSGGQGSASCQFYASGPHEFPSDMANHYFPTRIGASGGYPDQVTYKIISSQPESTPASFRVYPPSIDWYHINRLGGALNTSAVRSNANPLTPGVYVVQARGWYGCNTNPDGSKDCAGIGQIRCSRNYTIIIKPPATATPVPTPTPPPPSPTPIPLVTISSTVETDPSLTGGVAPQLVGLVDPYCSSPSNGSPFASGSIRATDLAETPYPGTVNSSGTYTISNLPTAENAYCIKFTPSDPKVVCSCPLGCTYCGKDAPTTQNLKFYVSPIGSSWYQTIGGEVAALNSAGNGLLDPIPQVCSEPGCLPYLSLPFLSDLRTVGSLMAHSNSTVDLSDATNTQTGNISPSGTSKLIRTNTVLVCRENYDYFYRLYSLGLSPSSDFPYPLDARKPSGPPADGKTAYFYGGGSTLTVSTPWTVSGSESVVIFVKGNLHIANTIMVEPKSFLTFIVSGNITIDPSVGTTDHATGAPGQVQGIYIANGSIQVKGATGEQEEKKFIGEGTFAACSGIKIDRDFAQGGAGLDNNKYPAALFIYRPDFMASTPDRMKTASFVWREVDP